MATVNHTNFNPYKVNKNNFRALRDDVIVEEMAFKERTLSSGIILLDDDAKGHGIRPRWGKVYSVGRKQKEIKSRA